MRVEFHVTSGSRAGERLAFEQAVITIGRHPSNAFTFDPEKDADVSSRHAEIRVDANGTVITDLNSTNGTFVNGKRVAGTTALRHGDVIAFGDAGPKVEFLRAGAAGTAPARRDTTARIAEAVEKQTSTLRTMIGALAGLIVVGVGLAYWAGNRGGAEAQKQVAVLLRQNDSLAKAFESTMAQLKGKSAGVDSALAAARRESDNLRSRLQAAARGGDAAAVASLSADLTASQSRARGLMGAAQVDWEAVASQNSPALVFLAVDLGEEGYVSGTGFNVSPSGLIVTNRHVVQDSKGRPASRIVGKFEKADGSFKRLTVVKVSQTDELAWLKIDGGGTYPTVQGILRNGTAHVGAPVGLIGYPLGTGTAGMGGDINKLKPVSTLTVGTASKVLGDTLQLDVYAAQGSSGSPVFNAQGQVIAVLFGSPTESNGRIIYAVPSAKLAAQMPPEGAAIIK